MTMKQIIQEFIEKGVRLPGTIYDGVFYPSSDYEGPAEQAENHYQFKTLTDTAWTLKTRFRDDPAVYVAGDMFIYYRFGDITSRLAPDVFVAAGVKGDHPRYSWRTWTEGRAPQFVLEVASESTWRYDACEKRRIYARMGVLEYWRFDPEMGKYLHEILIGERLVNGEYVRMPVQTDADGTLRGYSDFLKLDIRVRADGQIRLYDPAAGEWLLTPDETNAALRERDAEIERLRAALRAQQ